jgi:glycine/serine hydroxymethyltransferase
MRDIAGLIVKVLSNIEDRAVEKEVREDVEGMTSRFAVPGLDT